MRLLRHSLALLGLVAVAACDRDNGPTDTSIGSRAFVRYVNAVPDTAALDFRFVDGQIQDSPQTFTGTAFRSLGLGGYRDIAPGSRRMRAFVNDTNITVASRIILDTTFTFEAGKYYSILHTGFVRSGASPRNFIRVYEDARPENPGGGNVAVRVVHAAVGAPNVDAYIVDAAATTLPATPTAANVPFLAASGWVTTPARALGLRVQAGATPVIASTTANANGPVAGTTTGVNQPSTDLPPGVNVGGAVYTAWVLPAVGFGTGAATSTPTVLWTLDRRIPRP